MTIDLKRGLVVLYGERGEYNGKPRPGVIVQRQSTLADSPSITLCGVTSMPMPTNASRVMISPSAANGLNQPSFVMIDKVVSISRARIRDAVGQLDPDELALVDRALRLWLGL